MPIPATFQEYFQREAGEYLDALDRLLGEESPDPARLGRSVRAVRGSARVAGAKPAAEVAGLLEDAARALAANQLEWSEEVRERFRQTGADLRALVSGREESDALRAARGRWQGVGVRLPPPTPPPGGEELQSFLRAEIAGVVAALDRAIPELERSLRRTEPLEAALRRLRPLQGVVHKGLLAPVLELFTALEEVAEGVIAGEPRPGGVELLRAVRSALDAARRRLESEDDIVDDTPEMRHFRELRGRFSAGAGEAGAVPVTELFSEDEEPHLVSSSLAPLPADEKVEDFVRIEATGFLDRATGEVLGSGPGGDPVAAATSQLEAVRDLAATYGFSGLTRAAQDALVRLQSVSGREGVLSVLGSLGDSLPGAVPAETDTAREPAEPVPVEELLLRGEPALRSALALRAEVEEMAGSDGLRARVEEVFDLIELGLERRP
ncbi:MAG: Hpt domain-containing protein [Longimicrobiaceae bacterium]